MKPGQIGEDLRGSIGFGELMIGEPPSCYWDDLLAKQMCPKHGVPVAECPVDLPEVKKTFKGISPLLQDTPHEVESLKVSHYSVHCQSCGHPSLWHWHNEEPGKTGKCRAFQCHCLEDIPGHPVSPYCDECNHPIRWHDKAGPRCTALDCPCERTAA